MSILTLDLGKQTGWAILKGGIIHSGSESFCSSEVSNFCSWLNSLKQKFKNISTVYYEELRRHTDLANVLLAHLIAWCKKHNIAYKGVPTKTIKRFITGKGNASKGEVIEAVKNKGFIPSDDNEADALALLFLAQKDYGSKHYYDNKYEFDATLKRISEE